MKLEKQLAAIAMVGMMSAAAAATTFAAGVGYVNFDALVQNHKDFPKVSAQMQAAIKSANDEFSKKAPSMKTDQEKQALGKQLAQKLNDLENSLITPIEKDVVEKTEKVRKDKGLDCIVVQGSIIAGADNAVDETADVGRLLQ